MRRKNDQTRSIACGSELHSFERVVSRRGHFLQRRIKKIGPNKSVERDTFATRAIGALMAGWRKYRLAKAKNDVCPLIRFPDWYIVATIVCHRSNKLVAVARGVVNNEVANRRASADFRRLSGSHRTNNHRRWTRPPWSFAYSSNDVFFSPLGHRRSNGRAWRKYLFRRDPQLDEFIENTHLDTLDAKQSVG
mmetsp:Transcript_2427/g.5371  ORF Transcript_2427/g.5371 Transcript_2427/m.5371 type:complete len:192 (+) Transcript_2427:962-1537(+)